MPQILATSKDYISQKSENNAVTSQKVLVCNEKLSPQINLLLI